MISKHATNGKAMIEFLKLTTTFANQNRQGLVNKTPSAVLSLKKVGLDYEFKRQWLQMEQFSNFSQSILVILFLDSLR